MPRIRSIPGPEFEGRFLTLLNSDPATLDRLRTDPRGTLNTLGFDFSAMPDRISDALLGRLGRGGSVGASECSACAVCAICAVCGAIDAESGALGLAGLLGLAA